MRTLRQWLLWCSILLHGTLLSTLQAGPALSTSKWSGCGQLTEGGIRRFQPCATAEWESLLSSAEGPMSATAALRLPGVSNLLGCSEHVSGWFSGRIALLQRGGCFFAWKDSKRDMRPELDSFWQADSALESSQVEHTMLLDGGNLLDGTFVYDDDDAQCLMQGHVERKDDVEQEEEEQSEENQWYEFLAHLMQTLEGQPKDIRTVMAGQLLRYLAHRAVDSYHGYFLGHMGGRTADVTAALVSMRDNEDDGCMVEWGTVEREVTLQLWKRICTFIDCHLGSQEAEGQPVGREMPCIMLFGRPLPSRTPSTDSVQRPAKRRQTLKVEVCSAGSSTDDPYRSVSLAVPVERQVELTLRLSLHDLPASQVPTVAASDQASTVMVEHVENTMASTWEAGLPPPAPHGFGNFGLSETVYQRLWDAWRQGGLSVAEIRACHGPQVAQMVVDQWGKLPIETYMLGTSPATRDQAGNEAGPSGAEEDKDEAALLQGWWWLLPVGMAMPSSEDPFFCLARNMAIYLRRQGASMTVLATVLQELAWDRGDREYNLRYEDYLYRLGLPWECDRDRSDEIDPHHRDVLVWLETELWNDYVDWVEEETGFESEHVMDLRGQDCQWVKETQTDERTQREEPTDTWGIEL
eukprot:s1619_g4.t1